MAGECVGVVLEHDLLPLVKEAGAKAIMFKSLFNDFEATLQALTPIVQEIDKLSRDLDQPEQERKELIDKLKKGEQLVLKCSKVKWNVFKKVYYAYKLQDLDKFIGRFVGINMQAQQTRDGKKILLGVGRIEQHLNMDGKFSHVGIRPCSVPNPPEITPGLDVPLEDLKMILFKEDRKVTVVSAPGGSGKTTLVKKLCKDDQVQDKFRGNIFFVTVSKTPSVKIIVQKLFQHMRKDRNVPEFQTDEEAVNYLEQLLKEIGSAAKLLILDDVWFGSESIVQKFKFQLPNYKILVTSRSSFPQFGAGYNLKPLDDEAARTLFRHSATLPDGNSYNLDQDLVNKPKLRQMAAEAVLGIAAQELYAAIVRAKSNAKEFEFTLASLEKTVNLVTPKIIEIDRLNKKLEDFPKEEISVLLQQLEKARELVSMCSEIPRWNCYKKYKCTKRLNKMDLSLQKLLNVEFQAAQALDIQRVISDMIEINKKLDQMNLNENDSTESEGNPRKPKFEMNYHRRNEKGELHFRMWLGSRTR